MTSESLLDVNRRHTERMKCWRTQWSAVETGQTISENVSLASMSLCRYRSSAHLLKLTRTSVKLTGKLVCGVARLVPIIYRPILASIAGEAF